MNNLKLSHRLQRIVDLVPQSYMVADVGCDHGKVLAKLFVEGKINHAIGSDISGPSVEKTKVLLTELGFIDQCEIVVGDGFENIDSKKEIDACIVAGMGGREILQIMQKAKNTVHCWILQPMSDECLVRKTLNKSGYKIEVDDFIKDKGKHYVLLKVVSGKQKLSKMQVEFGLNFDQNETFQEYAKNELLKMEEYLKYSKKQSKKELLKRYKRLKKTLRRKS